MSKGYTIFPSYKSRVIAWDQNTQYSYPGSGSVDLVTITLPAGTFSAAGQTVMIEFWGDMVNTTGVTSMVCSFDGNDIAGTTSFNLPLTANGRNWYMKAMVTCITPVDEFVQNGICTWADQNLGTTVTQIVAQNAGGNPFAGTHTIILNANEISGALVLNVNHFLVTYFDKQLPNLAP